MDELMSREWKTWQMVIAALHSLGYTLDDINGGSENVVTLMDAMRQWGEELVTLRVAQSPDVRDSALLEARLRYSRYD